MSLPHFPWVSEPLFRTFPIFRFHPDRISAAQAERADLLQKRWERTGSFKVEDGSDDEEMGESEEYKNHHRETRLELASLLRDLASSNALRELHCSIRGDDGDYGAPVPAELWDSLAQNASSLESLAVEHGHSEDNSWV